MAVVEPYYNFVYVHSDGELFLGYSINLCQFGSVSNRWFNFNARLKRASLAGFSLVAAEQKF